MDQRQSQIAERIQSFSNEVMAYVEKLSDDDWKKRCEWEQWSVGMTAHHIGAGHLAIFNIAGMIINGEPLPPLTMDQINAMSNEQAQEFVNTTQSEALEQLEKNSASMVAFVKGLSDEQLDSKGSMPAFGGEVTTEQLIEYVIFQSAVEHFESIKAAVAAPNAA